MTDKRFNKVTVFTGNQPRHTALIRELSEISNEVFAVIEATTIFPGRVKDLYKKSSVMTTYFDQVRAAETEVFGPTRFMPKNARSLMLKRGDLSRLSSTDLTEALESDVYVVFGASFIRGSLCELLVQKKAINIHMGVSPYYRGCACNFWALNDSRIDLVGATIHLLSSGLDSGHMLFHALPKPEAIDPFLLGMKSVSAAHTALRQFLLSESCFELEAIPQDVSKELRFSRAKEFTDDVAENYLKNMATQAQVATALDSRNLSQFLRPVVI